MRQETPYRKAVNLLSRVKRVSREKGVRYVIRVGIQTGIVAPFWCYYYKVFKASRTFTFQGHAYHYFYHTYNIAWKSERAVEVPIVRDIVQKHRRKRILEVGNVLSHYFPVSHDILDKYEICDGVTNEDVVDFRPSEKYDLIISISTLEHVGWDEKPREPMKILRAIENLKDCLAPGGEIVVTLPVGFNTEMDKLLSEGRIKFIRQYQMKRISRDNRWIEVDWNEICYAKYGSPFPFGNGLIIGFIEKA
jgi:SAM-dependent methyltransferase